MTHETPPRLQLLCGCMLAALLVLNIDAARLDGNAAASGGSMVAELATRASVPSALDGNAARVQRDRDLRAAANYIRAVGVQDYLHLGNIKDILERFENIRERMLSFGAARDPRHRLRIRQVLRDVKERGEALQVVAGSLEAEGEVDDGGDELPTQRNNICSRIIMYPVELGFLQLVQLFCESLNAVRNAVNTGNDEEPMAYCVAGLLTTMSREPDYRKGHIGLEIEEVLGEERRWVAKHLALRPACTGNDSPPPEGTKTRFRRWLLRAWETQIWEDVEVDTVALPFKVLKEARDVLVNATVENELTLSSMRARIQRIDFCRSKLAQFISGSDPAFREQVREVFQEMQARMHSLSVLAARRVAAGDVDNTGDLLPSQRDNICTKLDAFGLQGDFREDVQKICETFDRLHIVVEIQLERNRGVLEMLGRMAAIRRSPDYSDTPVASELENLLAEEWSWLAQQGAVMGA